MKKKNGILILVIIGILVICSGIGFAAKKAYDRHKEELRLQAIETKNSEIDAEYQNFENDENTSDCYFLFGIYFFNGAKNLCSCMGVLRYKTCPFLV